MAACARSVGAWSSIFRALRMARQHRRGDRVPFARLCGGCRKRWLQGQGRISIQGDPGAMVKAVKKKLPNSVFAGATMKKLRAATGLGQKEWAELDRKSTRLNSSH